MTQNPTAQPAAPPSNAHAAERATDPTADPIVEIQSLTRRFGRTAALDDVTLNIPRGAVYGLVGENGAGKTTLIRHILGLLRAKSGRRERPGRVRVFGLDPVAVPERVLARIGFLSEDRDLPDWMRIHELMRYLQAFYPDWDMPYALQLADRFELDTAQKIRTLSRGQRARVGLLAALAHRPELLVLDEPSSGLDEVVRRDILESIVRTVSDRGGTVLFSSHLLEEVERVADRLAMIHHGRLVLEGDLDTVKSTHHRLTVRFPASLDAPPSFPGLLHTEGEARDWTCYANGDLAPLTTALRAQNAEIIEQTTPTLSEIFIARVRGRGAHATSATEPRP